MTPIPTDTECATCKGNGLVWKYPSGQAGTAGQELSTCLSCNGRGRVQAASPDSRVIGRPKRVDPGTLYAFAHQFYWDFRRLAEGIVRWRFDEKKFLQQTEGLEVIPLVDDEDRTRHQRIVDEEIRTGRLEGARRKERLQDIADSELLVRRESYRRDAAEEARREIKGRGELDVIKVLIDSNTTQEQVRALCRDAFMSRRVEIEPGVMKDVEVLAWPIAAGSTLPTYLSQYAEQFVEALRDPRFPRCDVSIRPSNRLKQFWFLSRALAGALFGVTARTAINLVGSMRPEQLFHESRDGKPARRQRKPTLRMIS